MQTPLKPCKALTSGGGGVCQARHRNHPHQHPERISHKALRKVAESTASQESCSRKDSLGLGVLAGKTPSLATVGTKQQLPLLHPSSAVPSRCRYPQLLCSSEAAPLGRGGSPQCCSGKGAGEAGGLEQSSILRPAACLSRRLGGRGGRVAPSRCRGRL